MREFVTAYRWCSLRSTTGYVLPSFQDEVVLGRAPPKQLYVGITFQQASASGGLDLGVIAERFPKLSSGVAMY